MGNRTNNTGSTVLMAKSYKMRMYQRRLWQNRTRIAITTIALWFAIIATILVIAEWIS
jgi:hypothetical protein